MGSMRRSYFHIVMVALLALACTGGTFTCESKKKDSEIQVEVNNR